MGPASDDDGDAFEDRCPHELVEAVVQAIARECAAYPDEEAAWAAFIDSRAKDQREYYEAIRRSRHTVFVYQQHEIYEFGARATGLEPDEICLACGRQYMRMISLGRISSLLKALLASGGSFRTMVVQIAREHLTENAGSQFDLEHEITPTAVCLSMRVHSPDESARYFEAHGLDPVRCFRDSFHFVAGALDKAFMHLIARYDPSRERRATQGQAGRMEFPIGRKDLPSFESFTRLMAGYVGRLAGAGAGAGEAPAEPAGDFESASPAMRSTWEIVRRASRSDEIVLLRGESGTGKSFAARKVHELSGRHDRPFVEVGLTSDVGSENMVQSDLFGHEKGAFTGAAEHKEGLFSLADGGTIFLDEIGDAPPEVQAKLLRVIESRTFKRLGGVRDIRVDVRIIAATNRDLEKLVKTGSFREDLYYRLNVISIRLPPLRERPEDIPRMAEFLFERALARGPARAKTLSLEILGALGRYPWPGNIRELDHALKYAAAISEGQEMMLSDLPGPVRDYIAGVPGAATPTRGEAAPPGQVIDVEALRTAIRASNPLDAVAAERPYEMPAHFEFAKRTYLATLIDECAGDLAMIARYWDRSSEKTIRKLIRECGLEDRLREARERPRKTR